MIKLSLTSKKLIAALTGLSIAALGIVCVLIAVDFFFTDNILYYFIGALIGWAFNVVKVIMLSNSIEKAVDMDPKAASNYMRLQYSSRFFLTIIVLIAAFKIPFVDAVGVIIELLLLQPASYIANFMLKKSDIK